MIVIARRMTLARGQGATALAALRAAVAVTVAEPGCLTFGVHAAPDDPDTLVTYEVWESREALDAYLGTAHRAVLGAALARLDVRSGDVTECDLAPGDPDPTVHHRRPTDR